VPKEAAAAAPATPPTTAASTTFEPIALEVRREGGPPATRSPANAPSLFTAELSLLASVRRGDGQTSAGVGVSSFLEYAQWLVGFTARLDRYGDSATDENPDAPAAVEIGALAGRRFRFGRHFIFDAAAGPALALRGSWAVMTVNNASAGMPTTMRSSSSHNDLVPRLLLGGRLTLGARSKLRTFVGIEGELGEAGPIPPGATRGLPRWSVGAALGVTVGTL
jgi:hypothetical protein